MVKENFYNKFYLEYAPILLILMIPFSIATGNFLPDFLACILGLHLLLFNLNYIKTIFCKNIFIFSIIIFFNIYLILGSLFSENILNSLNGSLFYFRFLIFALSISFYIRFITYKYLKYFFYLLVIFLLFLFFDIFKQKITGTNFFGWHPKNVWRVEGILKGEQILGTYVLFISFLILNLMYFFNLNKILRTFFFIFVNIVLFNIGDRAPFLIFSMFFLIYIFYESDIKQIYILIISFIFFILSYFTFDSTKKRIDDTLFHITSSQFFFISTFTVHHEYHLITAFRMFQDNKLFGVGAKNFKVECKDQNYLYKNGCSTHPHNYYFQLLSENGIVGIIIFLTGVAFFLIKYKKYFLKRYMDNEKLNFFIVLLLVFPLIPHRDFYNQLDNLILYTFIGIFMFFRNHPNSIR